MYNTMYGASEFHVTGNLKNWDITGRLGEILMPALITSGRYDEATPAIAKTLHEGLRGSTWVLFEKSAHEAHSEEPERYLRVVEEFLCRVEDGAEVSGKV